MGVISMAPILISMLPDRSDSWTTIRVSVGTSIKREDTTNSNTPGIRIFNVVGREIGEARCSKKVIATETSDPIVHSSGMLVCVVLPLHACVAPPLHA